MQIGPACYNIAPSRAITVTGPFLPWQRRYVVAKEEQVNSPGIAQPVVSGQEIGLRLFTMEPLSELTFLELDIMPIGTILYNASDPVPTVNAVQSAPFPLRDWTPAKARATWRVPGGDTTRSFDFDIGNGVVITTPPTNKVDVDLLVPSEQGLFDVPIPDGFVPLRDAGTRFATQVKCKATCVRSPAFSRPRFTQLVYLPGDAVAGSVGASVNLMPYATRVRVLAGEVPPSSALAVGEIVAQFSVDVMERAQGAALDPISALMPVFPIDFPTAHESLEVQVPQSEANVVRVSLTNPAKRANVVVVQDIAGI